MRWFPGCQTLTLTTKLSMFTHRMATISSTMQLQHQGVFHRALTLLPHLHPLKTFHIKQQCRRE